MKSSPRPWWYNSSDVI